MKIKRFDNAAGDLQRFLAAGQIDMEQFEASVQEIAQEVKSQGNQGIFACTARFDGALINEDNFLVSEQEIEEAWELVDDDYIISLRKAIDNIKLFPSQAVEEFLDGT